MRIPRFVSLPLLTLCLLTSSALGAPRAHAADARASARASDALRPALPAAPLAARPAPVVPTGPRLSDMASSAAVAPAPALQPPAALPAAPDAVSGSTPNSLANGIRAGTLPSGAAPPVFTGQTPWDATARARPQPLAPPSSRTPVATGGAALRNSGSAAPSGTLFPTAGAPHNMLYVVSDDDDPAYRTAIAALTGGTVDYFDARAGTPALGTLLGYDCVFAHPNYAYTDPVLLGNNLADYVDLGGKVILGFVNHSAPWEIAGRIRDPGYDPVTSGGTWAGVADTYAGDGATSYFAGVATLNQNFQEQGVVLQGPGVADGTYAASGEILFAYRPDARVAYVNGTGHASFGGTGDWAKIVANICLFGSPSAHTMLYAVADVDDPAFRAAVAGYTQGIVDYYDARGPAPSAALLATYECAFVHLNFNFGDPVTLGDRLADFVDASGQVILGIGCTTNYFGAPPALKGRIMTPGYSPVTSPAGDIDFSASSYAGDGTTAYHAGVLAYANGIRDDLVLQGAGAVDGHFLDGDIALAYRPDGKVAYINGTGHISFAPTGDWPKLVANACLLQSPSAHSMLYAVADSDDPAYRADVASHTGGPVDYYNAGAGTPSLALMNTYDCVYTYPNFAYSDNVLMGDTLADFVDGGGKAILGAFCTFTLVNSLGGRIMNVGYSPVTSPAGNNHYTFSDYLGDGTGPLYTGVAAFSSPYRDFLSVQGEGCVNGHFQDGEIAAAYRPDGRVLYTNGLGQLGFGTGDWARLLANACTQDLSSGHRMLYAPSEADDPAYRAAIAALTGGTVDYFDARAGTPDAALLSGYDCVYTWANYPYADRDLFGDRLADYVDAGGKAVLGVFCTFTSGNSLGGRIMTPGYSPVTSPAGNNHFAASPYAGDGTTCLHRRVFAYDQFYRDVLVLQGGGLRDGSYVDGEIALAYRPDRRVVYLNGEGNARLGGGTGDWPQLVANACECRIEGGQMLASTGSGTLYNIDLVTGNGYGIGPLPNCSTEIEYLDGPGEAWSQSCAGFYTAVPFHPGNATAAGAFVPNGATFTGLEWALDRLYGASFPGIGVCLASTFGTLDPAAGVSTPIGTPGALWTHPVVGLAFDAKRSTMYGLTSGCATGASDLLEIDVTTGGAVLLSGLPFRGGSLEWGPDGDLYGGGDGNDGGNLYRINPSTGATALVGNPGFGSISGLMRTPPGAVGAEGPVAVQLSLAPPYPNPSGATGVRLEFTLPQAGEANLELYDVAGRRVWSHAMGTLPAGQHSAEWNGRDASGRRAPSGVYFVRLRTSVGEKRVSLVRLQ